MQLQFTKKAVPYLKQTVWENKWDEFSQEIRLPDAMPDIGRVLGAWGQPLIRGKEWRSNHVSVSGGVMVWVVYAPEDGSSPRTVDGWIPFQMKWELNDSRRDGSMIVDISLQGVDARSTSARKMVVRTGVCVQGKALEQTQLEAYAPAEVAADVQILRESYPVRVPVEVGEKAFSVEEQLASVNFPELPEKLMYYTIRPVITEEKLMGDKLVLRGTAGVHVLCRCADGVLRSCEMPVQFSQYAELEKDYEADATAQVSVAVTNLELDIMDDGMLRLKAGLVGQYEIWETKKLEVVTDAYSTTCQVEPVLCSQLFPLVLDHRKMDLRAQSATRIPRQNMVDLSFCAAHPRCRKSDQGITVDAEGTFQMLYQDAEGVLQGETGTWNNSVEIPAAPQTDAVAVIRTPTHAEANGSEEETALQNEIALQLFFVGTADIAMATALEIGEAKKEEASKPSLILRRCSGKSLWDVAKECNSTVEAILQANSLESEPTDNRVLLIPVK